MTAFRLLLASVAALAVVAAVALIDHGQKGAAMHRAAQAAWVCAHSGERCAAAGPDVVEHRWHKRELAYRGGFGAAALVGGISLVRWRRSATARR